MEKSTQQDYGILTTWRFRIQGTGFNDGHRTFFWGGAFSAFGSSDVVEATRLADICLDAGLNMFDGADVYSAGRVEEILGRAIAGR
jgi:aryl-alcohol dehydrogenase-like predicted oxidoreductase